MALLRTHITVEKVLRDLEHTRVLALDSGSYAAAVRCSELQGKYLKIFSDRVEHVESIEEYSTERLVELLRDVIANGGIDLDALLCAAA